jgi:hypothetical protein
MKDPCFLIAIFKHHGFTLKPEKYRAFARITAFLALLVPFSTYLLDKVQLN